MPTIPINIGYYRGYLCIRFDALEEPHTNWSRIPVVIHIKKVIYVFIQYNVGVKSTKRSVIAGPLVLGVLVGILASLTSHKRKYKVMRRCSLNLDTICW